MLESVEQVLNEFIPAEKLSEVKRVLYGYNAGKSVEPLEIVKQAQELGKEHNFEIQAHKFCALKEQLRPPRVVRIGLVQNSIVLPTTTPVKAQLQAILDKIEKIIDAAGAQGVNVLCLQETWTMPFAFCTREKYPWIEFAESAENGQSVKFIQKLAKKA